MIRFENVSYRYKDNVASGETSAVQDLTFALEPGSFHFLCGPSGAGKTTVFRLLYLDLIPTHGRLNIFDRNIAGLTRDEIAHTRRRMGIVFQDARLLNHLSVRENVSLPLSLHGPLTREQDKCVQEILDWVGLSGKLDALPPQLSGGEQQRVSIARAVVTRPKLLIADEPTGNVDEAMGRRIMHLFAELNRHGTTVLVATHDYGMVRAFKNPALYIDRGRLTRQAA